jgi:hypothetical protein
VSGGKSFFGPYLYAGGGKGGKSQADPDQTQYTTVGGTPPTGGPGGAGAVRDGSSVDAATSHTTFMSPTGGGMGEGTVVSSSAGGTRPTGGVWAGLGGDGATFAGPGGFDGGLYGGGGGGGSIAAAGGNNGGDGAPGIVIVTVW